MFETIRTNKRVVQIVLGIIILPLSLFGIRSCSFGEDLSDSVAKVGSQKILKAELTEAFQRDRSTGEETQTQRKMRVLNQLIDQAAIALAVKEAHLSVSDESVLQEIVNTKDFQVDGKFSSSLYKSILAQMNYSEARYEQEVRQQLSIGLLLNPLASKASTTSVKQLLSFQDEQRVVASWNIDAEPFKASVKLPADAVQKYYAAHQDMFQQPERIKVEYVLLNLDDLAKDVKLTDEELKKWYDNHLSQFKDPEERQARHILVSVEQGASKESKDAARKRAEELLAKVKANPAEFPKIAKEFSDDKASAEKDGDLGFFRIDAMAEPFAKAAFALKEGQISDIVETKFGYHIIEVTGIHAEKLQPFEEAKALVTQAAMQDAANKRFDAARQELSTLAYEKPSTFEPVKEKLGLKIQTSDWIERDSPPASVLGNQKLLAELFSTKSLKERRNIDVVSLSEEGLAASGRVIDYKPTSVRPLEEVSAQIEKKLIQDEALLLAKKEGENKLAKIKAGESLASNWGEVKTIKRGGSGLGADEVKAVFSEKTDKLPAYVGVATAKGFSLYRIDKVIPADIKDDDSRIALYQQQVSNLLSSEDMSAYVKGLRKKFGVKILVDFSTEKDVSE